MVFDLELGKLVFLDTPTEKELLAALVAVCSLPAGYHQNELLDSLTQRYKALYLHPIMEFGE